MTNNFESYYPGIHKFLHHLDHIKAIVNREVIAPIHVSVWPTSECQCNCSYCCCRNDLHNGGEIHINDFKKCVDVLYKYGTKAMEFSGGGEPLLWKYINEAISYAHEKGIKLSLITNGYSLKDIDDNVLSLFKWIRVSLHSFNHLNVIDFKRLSKLSNINASYIVSNLKYLEELRHIHEFVKKENIIVRIAVSRPSTIEFEKAIENYVRIIGDPFFFSKKKLGVPLGCYMAWVRAAIDWRGMFLPCPSIQLNINSEGKIPENFSLCHINNLEEWLLNNKPADIGYRCEFCNCGKEHNDLIHMLFERVDDVEFV
jgi:MoaA/NifB/PqqE/SkfB family radical SAM enzyme